MKYSIDDFLEVKNASQPCLNHDGTKVAYLSNLTGTNQVYVMNVSGGEPDRLTDYPDSVSYAYFSPVADKIVFSKAENGNERMQLFLLDLSDRSVVRLTSNDEVTYMFGGWSSDGTQITYAANDRNGTDFDVYVENIGTRERKAVFAEGGLCRSAGFSPRGRYVAARKDISPSRSQLFLCNIETGENVLMPVQGEDVSIGSPKWLPDDSAFFIETDDAREFVGIARYDLKSSSLEYVYTPEWDVDLLKVSRDGSRLAAVVNEGGYSRLRILDPKTLAELPCNAPSGQIGGLGLSSDGSLLALHLHGSKKTADVWLLDLTSQTSSQITQSPQGVPSDVLVEPELIRYESFDGLSVPAFVCKPAQKSDRPLPVIIIIHGGPASQYSPGFSPITQYLVHAGFAVIAPNVRGSTGYGKTYTALDDKEKRMDSVRDLASLHGYIKSQSEFDDAKVALMGGSYGGFMVLAGLAFYPDLWVAGVDIVGIVNFKTFLENTASFRRSHREAEYGSLKHDADLLESLSPIHSVDKIVSPLMVIHGANDPRVPLSEAEQLVARLEELGKPVELLVYADEGHGLAKLKNRKDAYPKVVAFLQGVLVP